MAVSNRHAETGRSAAADTEKAVKKQEAEIRAMLEERMDDLSTSFRNRISKLTSELIADMQEGGSNRI